MLGLVRSQPKVLEKAARAEYDYEVLSMTQIRASEKMKTMISGNTMKHYRQAWKMT